MNSMRNFFKVDFPRLLLMTGKNKSNYYTVKLKDEHERLDYYNNVLYCLNQAINSLPDTNKHPYKTIIVERYINDVCVKDLEKIIKYSHSHTARLLNKSLSELINNIQAQQLKYNVLPILEFNND